MQMDLFLAECLMQMDLFLVECSMQMDLFLVGYLIQMERFVVQCLLYRKALELFGLIQKDFDWIEMYFFGWKMYCYYSED
mmetsp:Transcript_7247/g.13092  ORF Transcript_7247/g.13092 Transcript_7247/m.13092 type:complete len:80 (-) Transcript_7247:1904-2143(-)